MLLSDDGRILSYVYWATHSHRQSRKGTCLFPGQRRDTLAVVGLRMAAVDFRIVRVSRRIDVSRMCGQGALERSETTQENNENDVLRFNII